MSLQPFTLFSFNISACGFVLVGLKKIIIIILIYRRCVDVVDVSSLVRFGQMWSDMVPCGN